MLTLTQAAKRLHVQPGTLRRWCEEGRIASRISSDGERLISEVDVNQELCEIYQNISTCGGYISTCRV